MAVRREEDLEGALGRLADGRLHEAGSRLYVDSRLEEKTL
jgi:hypothetical protein